MHYTIALFLFRWSVGFLIFALVFLVTEVVEARNNPEYRKWLLTQPRKGTSHVGILLTYIAWPLIAMPLILSMFKGKSLLFTWMEKDAAKKEKEDAVLKEKEKAYQTLREIHPKWISKPSDTNILHCLIYPYGTVPVLSHYILEHPQNGCICFRAMPNTILSQVLFQTQDLSEAKAKCREDVQWTLLCLPGMEDLQRREWLRLKKEK